MKEKPDHKLLTIVEQQFERTKLVNMQYILTSKATFCNAYPVIHSATLM